MSTPFDRLGRELDRQSYEWVAVAWVVVALWR
jgi:hypothetical protein